MDFADLAARAVAYVDEHHPRALSTMVRFRFGGLRTIEPDRALVAAVVATGAATGVAGRYSLQRLTGRIVRIPLVPSVVVGPLAAWGALWRWDSARWRRRHVTLILDLPPAALDDLVDELALDGIRVQRWSGPRRPGGAAHGLTCRLGDLRSLNAALDAVDRDRAGGRWSSRSDSALPASDRDRGDGM